MLYITTLLATVFKKVKTNKDKSKKNIYTAITDNPIRTELKFSENTRVTQKTAGNLLSNFFFQGCARKTEVFDANRTKIYTKYIPET